MIERIIDFSVRHKLAILLATAIACAGGYWSLVTLRLDALPDLGETQVIISSQWDRSPETIEDQVTYPIVTALLGAPHVKDVRGYSDFGYSYVYVVFDDRTDLYWARSRVLEYLSSVRAQLPEGVRPEIGPDATSLGWIYQYALVDTTGHHSLAEMRALQDWTLRYQLKSIRGVADVAPVGGFTRQYQVDVDARLLQGYGITLPQVVDAVRDGNQETSGRLLDFGGTEYMVRGRGYAKSLDDFSQIVVGTSPAGTPVRVRDIGKAVLGPDMRRGLADLDGDGETVSGIVIMRNGENALDVIRRVKAKLAEITPSLPAGVRIVPAYDRSVLIERTISNVRVTILEVVVTVALIILVFLWHFPSAAIPLITMPVAVLLSFIPLRLMGISANVMSLAGVAIAFGELIDASIVVVEQTHKKLEVWQRSGSVLSSRDVVLAAVKEVARPTFFALLVIAVSFLPVLTLQSEEGKLFRPLAYSKSMAMIVAAVLALTLDPVLRLLLTRTRHFRFHPAWLRRLADAVLVGRVRPEEEHPISGRLMRCYEPIVAWTLQRKWLVLGGAAILLAASVPAFLALGSEFMPPMAEGVLLYMPTTMPGISIAQAQKVLQATDATLMHFPEVERVLGKAGRAETPTDPAPLSMLETLVILKPTSQWRHVDTWYSSWAPEWLKGLLRRFTSDTISQEELTREMDAALRVPGFTNAWTMPIRGRIDMLTTGMRTPVGLKIAGANLDTIEQLGASIQAALQPVRGTRAVFAEPLNQGHFIDIEWKREELARYGISVAQAQKTIDGAIGGDDISTVIAGRERYPVNVRYQRDFRSTIDDLGNVLVPTGPQRQTPLRELANLRPAAGPAMIRDENGFPTAYVYVDLAGRDIGSYIAEASRALHAKVPLPAGYSISWTGEYESMQRARKRLQLVVPATLAIIFLLIYMSTRSLSKTLIVLLAVPFSAIGAVWFLFLLHYNVSVATWVGLIGLLSIDAETGVFMLLYLDLAYEEARREGRMRSRSDLRKSILYGAARRLRPKFMTFATTCIGLFPVMWSAGPGSDVMKRIAAPMVGGIVTSFLLELLVYPAVYELWRSRSVAADYDLEAAHLDRAPLQPYLISHGD